MSRAQRLLDLIQLLRNHRFPVSGAHLADELGISLRTLYRDIATLQAQGASIQGEPGMGYVLQPGFMLPPLMFSQEEIEALVLGSRWVAARGDEHLGSAARNALSKIASVLPDELRYTLDTSALLVGPGNAIPAEDLELAQLRRAIRAECKIEIGYLDLKGNTSTRILWPFALGYFDQLHMLVAWCELRQDIRHFRTDRITNINVTDVRYPRRRQVLLKEWHAKEKIRPQ
ncbi:helix-turn-helix transcriptional regulator [Edaphovirga cremea]|uniref:helix-turn-helix transcriptional regulator n=1 Tax=Edaphovirga cremea TaxID=2267246 RepID=UPI000DEF65BE|nr:YafY family protein [Edaphovirga cremea]